MNLTSATANRLSQLVTDARKITARARRARQIEIMQRGRQLVVQLDAARVQLVRNGPDDLDAALAFEAAGTVELEQLVAQLDRIDLGIDRIAAERTDAADVIAWLEWHAIHLYPYQRRAIEKHLAA